MPLQPLKLFAVAVFSSAMVLTATAQTVDTAIDKGVQRADKAQRSQQKIDQLDTETRSIEAEYRAVLKENEGLNVYIKQLDKQISAQEQELVQIAESIRQVTLIERQITPLMLTMIDSLEQFVKADVPFQRDERLARVASLSELMGRSDVTVAEKYRKVMDAYQKEMNYGQTIKSYRGDISVDGQTKEVDFLRVGRIALMYQTLDGEQQAVWNQSAKAYEPVDSEYKSKLAMALRIAREQAAPDLIKVPVPAPVAAKVETAAVSSVTGESK
jgi:hypothetical protein